VPVSWLPPCINPKDDAYYNCFPQFASLAKTVSPGQDLTPALTTGTTFQFTMPADAVAGHPQTPGTPVVGGVPAFYGLAVLFNLACTGHLELLPSDPSNANPQALPVGCFDQQHNQLGANDFVFGFTTVYAYDESMLSQLSNTNPVIDSIDFDGTALTPASDGTYSAVTVTHCEGSCKTLKIGPAVPSSSWELNPEAFDLNGKPLHEQIWADFYVSLGSLSDGARLLYDATSGSLGGLGDTDDTFTPPNQAGTGFLWIVVHDNRAGASWATVPLTIQ
jgi:hypothetical protein